MGGTCSTYGREDKFLVTKSEEKKTLGTPTCRGEDNTKTDLKYTV
jgi:hypothetical protein